MLIHELIAAGPEHKCRCHCCASGIYPTGGYLNEGHLALRLDQSTAYRHGGPFWVATVDGLYVPDMLEACPGSEGYVVFYPPDQRRPGARRGAHRCQTCDPPFLPEGICTLVRYGFVRTWLAPFEAWDADLLVQAANVLAAWP